ncbi:unnamed protein product [Agarophyton chilense]
MPPSSAPLSSSPPPANSRPSNGTISIWAGDLDAYMDENFLRQAVTASGWGPDITRIKVVRDHYSGMHAGYGFLDAASPEAAQRVIACGSGMPIPGTNRCWRLNMGRNAAVNGTAGTEINIYVGNLEPSVTDYQLMTAFRPRYGSVRHAKVVCNEYGQSRGYGFVRFANAHDAERAVNEMQGFEFHSKPIRLSHATGRSRAPNSRGPSHHGYNNHSNAPHGGTGHAPPTNKRPRQLMAPDDPSNTTIFIGGTAPHITDELLWREFSSFGELDGVRVPVNKTGFAFVRFKTRESAMRAKESLSGTHFPPLNAHKPIRVEWASERIPGTKPPSLVNADMPVMNYEPSSQTFDPQFSSSYASNTSGANNSMQEGFNNFNSMPNGSSTTSGPNPSVAGLSQPQPGAVEDNKASGTDGAAVSSMQATAPVAKDGSSPTENGNSNGSGEAEPPSKRAAVGRPEYAPIATESTPKKENTIDVKPDAPSGDSPAMQFSWLNSSSTQPTSSPQ